MPDRNSPRLSKLNALLYAFSMDMIPPNERRRREWSGELESFREASNYRNAFANLKNADGDTYDIDRIRYILLDHFRDALSKSSSWS